ncbi:MAG: hypothetical protein EVA89_17710 [Sandaracinaceae bacterium]|nr:MAG: hypothetical protein EVA89_17710 [Sandaracinaceae bacterium]
MARVSICGAMTGVGWLSGAAGGALSGAAPLSGAAALSGGGAACTGAAGRGFCGVGWTVANATLRTGALFASSHPGFASLRSTTGKRKALAVIGRLPSRQPQT